MDRIDAMKVFIAALDHRSLAGAGRKLGRSPAAVSRAIAFLEASVGAELLYRTTRSIKTSQAGERYAQICRRILSDLEEAESGAADEQSAPRGTITITAPLCCGESVLRPILDAYLDAYREVSARLVLLDKPISLIDEGIDIALRVGNLADSTLIAVRVGEVRRMVVAAPGYLARHPPIETPRDLTRHKFIAFAPLGVDSCSFSPLAGSSIPQTVQFAPRLLVDSAQAAIESAVDGHGVTRAFSCQAAGYVRRGQLEIVLADYEHPAVPIHLITPSRRLSVPKVRAFVDFAVPRLRKQFAHLSISTVYVRPMSEAAD